jgi:hypothetical protein
VFKAHSESLSYFDMISASNRRSGCGWRIKISDQKTKQFPVLASIPVSGKIFSGCIYPSMYVRKNEKLPNSKATTCYRLGMTNKTIADLSAAKTIKMALIAVVVASLAIASFATQTGLANVAEAALLTDDPQGDGLDQQGNPVPDLDIKKYGIAGKRAYIQVYGTAGGTLADHDHAIAYVINVITAKDELQTWAIDSHEKQHGDTNTGEEWHAHRVHLGDNPNTIDVEPLGCVNEVDQVNHATVEDKRVWFENMVVRGDSGDLETVDVVGITSALTVELHVLVDDPDNPGDAPCIAEVSWVFDST